MSYKISEKVIVTEIHYEEVSNEIVIERGIANKLLARRIV